MARGLRAVGAVLAAAASLDVDERAHLDFGWVVEFLVDGALEWESVVAVRFGGLHGGHTAAWASFMRGVS